MTSFLYRAPSGIAGDVTRPDDTVVEPGLINSAQAPTAFGAPVKLVSGKIEKIAASDLASVFAGILSRIAPSIAGDLAETFAGGTPNTESVQGIVTEGFVNVACTIGTPVRGDIVRMRVVADTGKAVGALEATADAVLVPGVITGTGTGTLAGTVTGETSAGTWSLVLQTTSGTSKVTVIDPLGVRRADATVGTPYTSVDGFVFTITAAGTMTAGDSFAPLVTQKNVKLSAVTWAVDGKDSSNITEIRIK